MHCANTGAVLLAGLVCFERASTALARCRVQKLLKLVFVAESSLSCQLLSVVVVHVWGAGGGQGV